MKVNCFRITVILLFCVLAYSCKRSATEDEGVQNFRSAIDRANKQYNNGNMKGSIDYLDSFYAAQERVPSIGRHLIYAFKTRYYLDNHNSYQSLSYADSSLRVFNDVPLREKFYADYVHALLEKGQILFGTGGYDSAYNYFLSAELLAKKKAG